MLNALFHVLCVIRAAQLWFMFQHSIDWCVQYVLHFRSSIKDRKKEKREENGKRSEKSDNYSMNELMKILLNNDRAIDFNMVWELRRIYSSHIVQIVEAFFCVLLKCNTTKIVIVLCFVKREFILNENVCQFSVAQKTADEIFWSQLWLSWHATLTDCHCRCTGLVLCGIGWNM